MIILYTIMALLLVIAVVEIIRLRLTTRNISKKAHYKQKLRGTERMRWDLEFKVEKTNQIREDVRKKYDYMKSRVATVEESLKTEKDKAEKANLEDKKVIATKDAERLLNQIKALDLEVNGCKPCQQYPDGHTGIVDQIASMRELEGMLSNYIRTL